LSYHYISASEIHNVLTCKLVSVC